MAVGVAYFMLNTFIWTVRKPLDTNSSVYSIVWIMFDFEMWRTYLKGHKSSTETRVFALIERNLFLIYRLHL